MDIREANAILRGVLRVKETGGRSSNITPLGIAIGGVGNRVTGTIVTGGDAGHAAICKCCPYKKWGEKLRKQGLVIPGVDSK